MVGYSSSTGKYQASIRIPGKLIFLGEYKTNNETYSADMDVACKAGNKLSGHINTDLPYLSILTITRPRILPFSRSSQVSLASFNEISRSINNSK